RRSARPRCKTPTTSTPAPNTHQISEFEQRSAYALTPTLDLSLAMSPVDIPLDLAPIKGINQRHTQYKSVKTDQADGVLVTSA
ncbi:MAG TPA: hypothetical protein VFU13_24135, partial [Steroidobacteraceae bacterium]|nr:hypothetical protein [Steroidobacteraceae bacterium]